MLKKIKQKIYNIKFYLKHGFPQHEVWDIDNYLVKWLLPRLKVYRNNLHAYPPDITMDEWETVLDEIIWSFEHYDDCLDLDETKRILKGKELFGKYWAMLWD